MTTIFAIRGGGPASNAPQRHLLGVLGGMLERPRVAMLVVALAALIWGSIGFTLAPVVNHDEVMLNAAARAWQRDGHPSLPPLAEVDPSYAQAYYWHPPGHMVVGRAVYAVFGFSLRSTRAISLVFTALLASAWFALAYCLGGRSNAAYASVALFFANELCWWLPRSGRMDPAALFFAVLGVLCSLRTDSSATWRRPLLAGGLIGIGSLFHVVASFFVPAILVAEFLRDRRVRWLDACTLVLAAATPLLLWIGSAFLRGDGHAWIVQFVDYQLRQRHARVFWSAPATELILLCHHAAWAPVLLPLLALAAVTGWHRFDQATARWLLGGFVAAFLAVAFTMGKDTGVYPLYWYGWLALLAGAGLPALLSAGPSWRRILCWLAVLAPFAWQGLTTGIALYQHTGRNPVRVEAFFSAHLAPGSIVLGPEDIWYGVEAAHASLRIWQSPDPARHDYFVTRAGAQTAPPPGFALEARLPDIMPKIFGHYLPPTSCGYNLWISRRRHPELPRTFSP